MQVNKGESGEIETNQVYYKILHANGKEKILKCFSLEEHSFTMLRGTEALCYALMNLTINII